MPIRSQGSAARQILDENWTRVLTEARDSLWHKDLENAARRFEKIVQETERLGGKGKLNATLFNTQIDAMLGLWAVQYLQNSELRAEFKKIILPNDLGDRSLFIGRVFMGNEDTHPEALAIYRTILEQKPTENNINVVLKLLNSVPYSPEAFSLLKYIYPRCPNHSGATALFIKWSIKAGRFDQAEQTAKKVLTVVPIHLLANRCLGYLAEKKQDWMNAARYYGTSQDWLRQAVCLNHSGYYSAALDALNKVEPYECKSAAWLYQSGWASYQTGKLEDGLRYWRELKNSYPAKAKAINEQISLAENRAYQAILNDIPTLAENQEVENFPDSVRSEALMRAGVYQFLVKGQPGAAEQKLHQAAAREPKNPLPSTVYLACVAAQRNDPAFDKAYMDQLQKVYGSGGLFLFLRGVWLMQSKPLIGQAYLQKAREAGLNGAMPDEAIEIAGWLAKAQVCRTQVEDLKISAVENTSTAGEPFYQAVTASLVAERVRLNAAANWPLDAQTTALLPDSGRLVPVYLASRGDWTGAIQSVHPGPDYELEQAVSSGALKASLAQPDWDLTAEVIELLCERFPNKKKYRALAEHLSTGLLARAWKNKDYLRAETYLLASFQKKPGDTGLHHRLAIFYTRWALEQAEQPVNPKKLSPWEAAIGHWAVVLTDKTYWREWKAVRSAAYEDGLDEVNMGEVILGRIPDLFQAFFNERESFGDEAQADTYHRYAVLVDQELDAVEASRRLMNAILKTGSVVNKSLACWISPLLTMAHSNRRVIKVIKSTLDEVKLSKEDDYLLKIAFSPLWQVHVIGAGGMCQQALDLLDEIESDPNLAVDHRQMQAERAQVLEYHARSLIKAARWKEAKQAAEQLKKLVGKQRVGEMLYAEAHVGLVKEHMQKEDRSLEKIVQSLKEAKKSLSGTLPELDALLLEALTLWGNEALKENNIYAAQLHFQEALTIASGNLEAKEGMAQCYLMQAYQASQRNNLAEAWGLCQQMYRYGQSVRFANFYAAICHDYAGYLSDNGNHRAAVEMVEEVIAIPYDHSEIDLISFLSTLYTNYGAQLYNNGYQNAGMNAMQRALNLNPSNETARNNLRISNRGW